MPVNQRTSTCPSKLCVLRLLPDGGVTKAGSWESMRGVASGACSVRAARDITGVTRRNLIARTDPCGP